MFNMFSDRLRRIKNIVNTIRRKFKNVITLQNLGTRILELLTARLIVIKTVKCQTRTVVKIASSTRSTTIVIISFESPFLVKFFLKHLQLFEDFQAI